MMVLKWTVFSFAMFATAAQPGGAWSWLNGELGRNDRSQQAIECELMSLPQFPVHQGQEHAGFHSGLASSRDAIRWVQVDLGSERVLDAVFVVPAMLGTAQAYGFPSNFRLDASNDPLFADSIPLLDHHNEASMLGLAPWQISAHQVKARYVRFTATKLAPQPGSSSRFIFCLGELLVFSEGRNVALQGDVLAPNSAETLPTWSPKHLVDGAYALGLPMQMDGRRKSTNGWHSAISSAADEVKWVQVDLGDKHRVDELRLIPAHPSDFPDRFGFGFPRRFKIEADGRMIFDSTSHDFPNPGDTPVVIPMHDLQIQTIRMTATQLWERSGDFVFALAELQAFTGGQNIALGSSVTSSDETVTVSWRHEYLVDGLGSSGVLIDEAEWLAGLSRRRELTVELGVLAVAQAAAYGVAQKRAFWLAGLVLIGVVSYAGFSVLHSRHLRERELESLRQRISRDLHDEIGSHLGSIRLMSELALRDGQDSDSLEEIHRLAGEAAESMRGIIWLVREGDAPKLNSLVEAMRQSATSLLKGIDWTLEALTIDQSTTASLEFHRQSFLFFREAAHNITRHANAANVKIEISWKPKHLHLRIEDNGCGFDVDAVTAGNGLANLRHRAGVLKGSLQITSDSGKGTHITLDAPLS
jgi:signal transduction histidine kinase